MFAKPTKKANNPAVKQKAINKAKTVSVKTGIKAPIAKRLKPDGKVNKLKPAQRQDAGYSLYSTDSEDQVATAFTEMEACEKILTQLKSKPKEKIKVKKKKVTSPKPKALNDGPPLSQVPTDYMLPFSTALYLRHLHNHDPANNPVYNSRLVSSTPDPEKLLADLSSSKLPSNLEQTSHDQVNMAAMLKTVNNMDNSDSQHDLPERDVSGTSSAGPSYNHLRNMAEMVEMYNRIEMRKYQQLQEAAILAELEKLRNKQSENVSQHTNESGMSSHHQDQSAKGLTFNASDQGQVPVTGQGHLSQQGQGQVGIDGEEKRQSGGFMCSGSLGFIPAEPGSTGFKPIPFDTSQLSAINSMVQESLEPGKDDMNTGPIGSSSSGFQPYLETTGPAMLPSSWVSEHQKQLQQQQALQAIKDLNSGNHGYSGDLGTGNHGRSQVEPLRLMSDIIESDKEAQNTGRTESTIVSHDTDYAKLPRPVKEGQGLAGPVRDGETIEFSKQNGLFQVHRASAQQEQVSDRNSGSKSNSMNSEQIIPERDIPSTTNTATSHGKKDRPAAENALKDVSPNLSDVSTPRTQNASGTSSGMSHSGRVVFIPSDNSGTQNMIGYIPGIPMVSSLNQPMSWPVTCELAPDGSVLSSVTGPNQGQVTLPTTSQVTQQNASGSGYHSNAQANNIAAGDIGVRKLRYLIKELKECNKVTKDTEINRLVTEVDSTVNAIPQLSLTFNLHTEIELAIQPLRNENSQLRRKLRLTNQQLKDKDDGGSKDINFEKLHLQTSNENLQKLLKEEKEIKTRMAGEVQHVHAELHKMRVDRSKMIAEVSEKETLNLKFRQETLLATQEMAHEVQIMKKEQEAMSNKLEAQEKENHILQITLQQRDAEIERQHEVVETMKESITDLLHELEQSRSGEHGWDQNTSYGLNKLMRIMEEEETGYSRKQPAQHARQVVRRRTPERHQFDFNSTTDSSSSMTKLTREALANHDRKHTRNGTRLGLDGRQGPASESELDTLVELHRRGRDASQKRTGGDMITEPKHRRRSSSSPVRLRKSPQGGAFERDAHYHTRLRSRKDNSRNGSGFEMYDRNNGKKALNDRTAYRNRREISKSCESSPAGKGMRRFRDVSPDSGRRIPEQTSGKVVPSNRTEISDEQSRYSVTEYFRKYPSLSPDDQRSTRPQGQRSYPDRGQSSSLDDPRSHMPQGQRSYPDRGQSLSLDDPRSRMPQGQSSYPDRGQSSSPDDPRSRMPQGQSSYPDRGQSSSLDDPRSRLPQGQSSYPVRGQSLSPEDPRSHMSQSQRSYPDRVQSASLDDPRSRMPQGQRSYPDRGQSSSLDDPRSHMPQGQSSYPVRGQSSSPEDPRSHMSQSQRSYPDRSQPARNIIIRSQQLIPESRFQTSSEVDIQSSNAAGLMNIKQRTLFRGHNYDDTISAIPDDDQVSSVSMSSVTTANTIDDKRFQSGIATLDANIAKLQMALRKTKSMLN